MADYWTTDWLNSSALFAPLRAVGAGLPEIGWPDTELLNALAVEAGRVVNAQGQRVRFVAQASKSKDWREDFEPRAFLRGEVQVRALDWHDLFNALVWMTFPTTKAVINARHYELMAGELLAGELLPGELSSVLSSGAPSSGEALSARTLAARERAHRSPARDALTLFDEDGVVVVSSDPELLQLVRDFRWKDLFWKRRGELEQRMRFCVFGHALYHKAMHPFIGMTGKALLLEVPQELLGLPLQTQLARIDRLLAAHAWDREHMRHGRDFAPLPVLGIPGWHVANEEESFYANAAYFRPGRSETGARFQPGGSSV